MSKNDGTLTRADSFYHETEGWKEINSIARVEIKSLFELREKGYEMTRSYLDGSKTGKQKFYLLIAKQAIYVVKYLGRDEAARVSKKAELAPDLENAARVELERGARRSAGWVDAFADCTLATVGWVLGAYTGGVFLLIGGVGASARCGVSVFKLAEALQGKDESFIDTPTGQVVDMGVTVVNLVGAVGGAISSAAKAIMYWRKVGQAMSPAIAHYFAQNAPIKLAKLLLVDLPEVALTGYDLMTKFRGSVLYGAGLEPFLQNQQEDAERPPCLPYEPMFRSPADWLRDTIENGFVHLPWSEECRP